MLVLSRQRDETVMIGDEVQVTVVDIRGDKVRLGIQAPKDVSVHRKEVYDAIRRENRSAAQMKAHDFTDLPKPDAKPGKPTMRLVEPGDEDADSARHAGPAPLIDPAARNFMREALEEAHKGLKEGGLPIGSVLVRGDKVIAAGHNRRVQDGNPMAHAEIDCLTRAGRQKTYKDTVLYSTLVPCYLCSGAAVQFAIPTVIVGESINFHGAPEFLRKHGINVTDLRDPDCIDLMSNFIRDHPDLWNEDIGHTPHH